jgi:hypothetical protein
VAYALGLSRRHLYNRLGTIRTTGRYSVASSSNHKARESIAKSRYISLDAKYCLTYEIGNNRADEGSNTRSEVLMLGHGPRSNGAKHYRYGTAHCVELKDRVMLE